MGSATRTTSPEAPALRAVPVACGDAPRLRPLGRSGYPRRRERVPAVHEVAGCPCVRAAFGIPFGPKLLTGSLAMRDWFTFENLPLTLIILLVVVSWLSFFSVILFAD